MADVHRSQSGQGRVGYRLLSLLFSAVLIVAGVAVLYGRVNWHDVVARWTSFDPTLVAVAAVLYWLQFPLNTLRLRQVILWATGLSPEKAPSFSFLFKLNGGAAFIAVAAPIGLAGDAAKIVALRLLGNLSVTEATRCALFDRVIGVQFLSLFGLAALPLQLAFGVDRITVFTQLVAFAGVLTTVVVLLVFPLALSLLRFRLIDRIAGVFANYRRLLHPERLATLFVIVLINTALAGGTLYLLLQAAHLESNIWLVAAFIPLLQLINGLPFLYMGWGGRELAMAATLGAAGSLSINSTVAVSVVWGLILIVTSAINGVFLLGDWRTARKPAATDWHLPSPSSEPRE